MYCYDWQPITIFYMIYTYHMKITTLYEPITIFYMIYTYHMKISTLYVSSVIIITLKIIIINKHLLQWIVVDI